MPATPDESLAASVFALGLRLGFVRRDDVVRWADLRIESSPGTPPDWLIDLSLSPRLHLEDLIHLLQRLARGADPAATCRAVYALLPDVAGHTFDQSAAFAARLYQITYECLDGDWSQPLLSAADNLADNFDFLRDGDLDATELELIAAVRRFVDDHRDERIVRLLDPVRWSEPAPHSTP